MEDSRALRKQLQIMLEKKGYQVEAAENGREGLQKVEVFRPAVVFTDLMMPEVDGFEVVSHLHEHFPDLPIVAFSAQPASLVRDKILRMGAEMFLQKPLKEAVFTGIADKYITTAATDEKDEAPKYLPQEDDQPYRVQIKSCYICSCDHVNVFVPIEEAYEEEWETGLFPTFKALGHYHQWDFLKTAVSVCPSCFFASRDPNDFANSIRSDFPYHMDAKRLLEKGMGTRKRLIDAHKSSMEMKFTNPNRSPETVLAAFRLAEKCGNGLVMGEKAGSYTQMGIDALLLAVLEWEQMRDKEDYLSQLRAALEFFLNQLKLRTDRVTKVKTYYFIIALYMALGQSIKAGEVMSQLEEFYQRHDPETASDEERTWNQRLLHIWQEGINVDALRPIK
jgi:CheY-like chemotaxis protein